MLTSSRTIGNKANAPNLEYHRHFSAHFEPNDWEQQRIDAIKCLFFISVLTSSRTIGNCKPERYTSVLLNFSAHFEPNDWELFEVLPSEVNA